MAAAVRMPPRGGGSRHFIVCVYIYIPTCVGVLFGARCSLYACAHIPIHILRGIFRLREVLDLDVMYIYIPIYR